MCVPVDARGLEQSVFLKRLEAVRQAGVGQSVAMVVQVLGMTKFTPEEVDTARLCADPGSPQPGAVPAALVRGTAKTCRANPLAKTYTIRGTVNGLPSHQR